MRVAVTANGVKVPIEWAPFLTQYTVIEESSMAFELIHKPLWHTRTYVDNTSVVLNFFDVPLATDDLGTVAFPLQDSYLLKGFGFYMKAAPAVSDGGAAGPFASGVGDIQILSNTGVMDLTIGRKSYGPFPMWRLSPGGGIWGAIAAQGAEAVGLTYNWGQIGMPTPEALFRLAIPLVIPAQTNTSIRLRWPAGAVDTTGNQILCCLLEGITASPLQ